MALVAPDTSEILLLKYIVGLTASGHPVLHLFSNNVTPSDSTVIGNLTEVTTPTGYSSVTLTSSSWTVSQSGGVTTANYAEQTFNFATSATAYGYYVTDTSGNLLWLERFSGAPFEIPDGGGTISITSKLTLS